MRRFRDRTASVIEYVLAVLWLLAGVSAFGQEPFNNEGPVAQILGGTAALYAYTVIFSSIGILLIYAKVRKRKELHKRMLLISYLVATYTLILEVYIDKFGLNVIDSVIFAGLSGWLFLRWKFKTEYIDLADFDKSTAPLRVNTLDKP